MHTTLAHDHDHPAASTAFFQPLAAPDAEAPATHEIRFWFLFREGRALAFPCDGRGHVDLDGLSDRARDNYLYARAMVGREFAVPVVRPIALQ